MKVSTGVSCLCTFSSVPAKPSAHIPASLPRVFTYSDAIAVGLPAERLYRYRDEGSAAKAGETFVTYERSKLSSLIRS